MSVGAPPWWMPYSAELVCCSVGGSGALNKESFLNGDSQLFASTATITCGIEYLISGKPDLVTVHSMLEVL